MGLVPLWLVTYPPSVDLPQHAAQVAIWLRWDGGGFDYAEFLWVNWQTPYLVANSLAAVLALWMPVAVAFKVVISLAVVGIPLATLALLRETGGNPWWALVTIPMGYSFAFYMGFVAFALATPIALICALTAWKYAHRPTLGRGGVVFLLLQLLFLTHIVAFGWAGLIGASFTAFRAPTIRAVLFRWWPFFAAMMVPGTWVVKTLVTDHTTQGSGFGGHAWSRLPELPALLVGLKLAAWPFLIGVLLLAIPFAMGGKASRDRLRWLPLTISLGLYLLGPFAILGTGFLNQRFAVFILPSLLFALDVDTQRARLHRRSGLLAAALIITWFASLSVRFIGYQAEVGALSDLLERAETHRRVLYLAFERDSEFIPYPVFLHSGLWYQVERGGLVDFSFATYFPNRFRYRPDAWPPLPAGIEWQPWIFDWHRDGGELYDYILVRSVSDPSWFFARTRAPLIPVARASGGWWLWERQELGDRAETTDPEGESLTNQTALPQPLP